MKKIKIIVFILLFQKTLLACTCGWTGFTTIERYNRFSLVFIGTIIGYQKVERLSYWKFKTDKILKGKLHSDTLTIYSSEGCEFEGYGSKRWLMFVRYENEKFITGLCYGNICLDRLDTVQLRNPNEKYTSIKQLEKEIFTYDTSYFKRIFGIDSLFYSEKYNDIGFQERKKDLSAKGLIIKGQATGYWAYYSKKNIREEGFYNKGLKNGIWYSYFENRMLESVSFYKNGTQFYEIHFKEDGSYSNIYKYGFSFEGWSSQRCVEKIDDEHIKKEMVAFRRRTKSKAFGDFEIHKM